MLKGLHTILLEAVGFARAEPLNGIFLFEDAFLDSTYNAGSVGTGILGNGVGLPHIDETTDNTCDDEENQGVERTGAEVGLGEATEILAIVVQDVGVVFM